MEANVEKWISSNTDEADRFEMTELLINDPKSWRNWWRGNEDLEMAISSTATKGKSSAAKLLVEKWDLKVPKKGWMPPSWLAFVIWGPYATERWNLKVSTLIDVSNEKSGMSRKVSKLDDKYSDDIERLTNDGRGQTSSVSKQEQFQIQKNLNESRMCAISEFSALQASNDRAIKDIKEQIKEAENDETIEGKTELAALRIRLSALRKQRTQRDEDFEAYTMKLAEKKPEVK